MLVTVLSGILGSISAVATLSHFPPYFLCFGSKSPESSRCEPAPTPPQLSALSWLLINGSERGTPRLHWRDQLYNRHAPSRLPSKVDELWRGFVAQLSFNNSFPAKHCFTQFKRLTRSTSAEIRSMAFPPLLSAYKIHNQTVCIREE